MLATIGLAVLVIVPAILVLIATRPASFRVARSTTIAAPPEVVFAQIEDLHNWEQWSPFERTDLTMSKAYEGPRAGVGASFHYVGRKIGEGRMTIAESTPHEGVRVKAEFIKPFAATNQIEFLLKPAPGGVAVTWAMNGINTFAGKAISLVANMDRMVGKDFEQGLANLKRLAEGEARILALTSDTATGRGR